MWDLFSQIRLEKLVNLTGGTLQHPVVRWYLHLSFFGFGGPPSGELVQGWDGGMEGIPFIENQNKSKIFKFLHLKNIFQLLKFLYLNITKFPYHVV